MTATDVVNNNNGFFASPGGAITLFVLGGLTLAFLTFLFKYVPKLLADMHKVVELFFPDDVRKEGLQTIVERNSNKLRELELRLSNHLEVSADNLREIREDIGRIREPQ